MYENRYHQVFLNPWYIPLYMQVFLALWLFIVLAKTDFSCIFQVSVWSPLFVVILTVHQALLIQGLVDMLGFDTNLHLYQIKESCQKQTHKFEDAQAKKLKSEDLK